MVPEYCWFSAWPRFERVEVIPSPTPFIVEEPATGKAARLRGPNYMVQTLAGADAVLFKGEMAWYDPGEEGALAAWLEVLNKAAVEDYAATLRGFLRKFGPLGLYYSNMGGVDFDRDKQGRRVDVIETASKRLPGGTMLNPDYWRTFHLDRKKPPRLVLKAEDVFTNYLEPLPLLVEQVEAFRRRLDRQTLLEPVVTKYRLRTTQHGVHREFMYRTLLDHLSLAGADSQERGATPYKCAFCGELFLRKSSNVEYCSTRCRDTRRVEYIRAHQQSPLQKRKMVLRSRLANRKSDREQYYRELINDAATIEDLDKLEQEHEILQPRRERGGK